VTPERWLVVKALFAEAEALPAEERSAFVQRAAGGDDEIRDEVLSLLGAAEGPDSLPGVRAGVAAAAQAAGVPHAVLSRTKTPSGESALRTTLEGAIGGQYEIIRALGHGGMGMVYLARERALERFVAIKVLRPELAEARQGPERFRREARIAAQLAHPGIVPLHTFGEVGGLWYFVMGYVRGDTLAERLRLGGRLPVAEARRIIAELADALESAHAQGVIHRDIKPANILLDASSGRAVLADFGIAKMQGGGDSLTATGMVVGTPSFMSPEALAGEDVDARSDLYSLGAVAYAMLTGREPFARTDDAMPALSAAGTPAPLYSVAPEVPDDLARVVMRCLSRDPALRFPSARALRDALALMEDATAAGLPASVRDLPAFGPYAVLWAGAWLAIAGSPFRSAGDRALLSLIALVVPAGLVLHVWNVVGRGLSLSQVARVAFWPPDWWGMWWPRGLRRPSDLWARLPMPARAVRAALSAFLIALPALILTRRWVEAVTGAGVGWFGAAESVLVTGAVSSIVAALIWAKGRGLTLPQATRLMFGATTASESWDSPAGRLLLDAARTGGDAEPDDAAGYCRAIGELAERVGEPARAAARDAADVARRVLHALERMDVEIRALSAASGSRAIDHVTSQLSTLESATSGDEMDAMIRLLRAQLEEMRRLQVQCELLSARRARMLELLRALWRHTAASRTADGVEESLARLAVVRREIELDLEGK
jgi:tRNA A-37 threonylcarbamoyl transferase component Bud32